MAVRTIGEIREALSIAETTADRLAYSGAASVYCGAEDRDDLFALAGGNLTYDWLCEQIRQLVLAGRKAADVDAMTVAEFCAAIVGQPDKTDSETKDGLINLEQISWLTGVSEKTIRNNRPPEWEIAPSGTRPGYICYSHARPGRFLDGPDEPTTSLNRLLMR